MDKIIEIFSGGIFTNTASVDESQVRWQNGLVGKLHALTGSLLFVCSSLLFAKELLGEHIHCTRHSAADSFISEATFDSYCYITDTFTLANQRKTGVHPGVGPGHHGQQETIFHSYYQWVPFILLIQAASFYGPYILYKFAHDNRIPQLIQDLQNTKPFHEVRNDKIGDIPIYLQDFYGSHNLWAYKLVLSDALNLLNIILNIALVQWFLGGQFIMYGFDFMEYQMRDIKDKGDDPFHLVFPKMTKCTLEMYGPSGTIVNYDGLCVLPVNILNEKIFLLLWFLFFPLLMLTVVEQIVWITFIANKQVRNWHLLQWVLPPVKYRDGTRRALASKERYNMEKQEAKSHLRMVLNTIGFADWLVIYMVARNIDRALFTSLARQIHPPGFGYYPDEEEEDFEEDNNNV